MYSWPDELDSDYEMLNKVTALLYREDNPAPAAAEQVKVLESLANHIKKYNPPEDVIVLLLERVLENSYEIAFRVSSKEESIRSFDESMIYSETKNFLDFIEKHYGNAYKEICLTEPYNTLVKWFKK